MQLSEFCPIHASVPQPPVFFPTDWPDWGRRRQQRQNFGLKVPPLESLVIAAALPVPENRPPTAAFYLRQRWP
jgi:hypothetical protein